MGAADADKEDVISECVRQLSDVKTYLKLTEEETKNIITRIAQNKRQTFCYQKKIFLTFRISILFGKFFKILLFFIHNSLQKFIHQHSLRDAIKLMKILFFK